MNPHITTLKTYQAWQLKQPNYSASTFAIYFKITFNFLNRMGNQGLGRLNDVNAEKVMEFIHFRKGHPPYSPASVKVRTAALHLFFSWALSQRLVRDNPVVLYKRSRITSKEIPLKSALPKTRDLIFLNNKEQKMVLHHPISKDFLDIRNRSIITLLLASGLFIEELISLSNKELCLKQGSIEIKGLNRKERKVYLNVALCEVDYKNWLKIHPLKACDNFPLFITRKLKPLSIRALYNIVSQYLHSVGIQKKWGANILRQTAIINAIRAGDSIEKIQKNFGIQSYEHAKTYTSYSLES